MEILHDQLVSGFFQSDLLFLFLQRPLFEARKLNYFQYVQAKFLKLVAV